MHWTKKDDHHQQLSIHMNTKRTIIHIYTKYKRFIEPNGIAFLFSFDEKLKGKFCFFFYFLCFFFIICDPHFVYLCVKRNDTKWYFLYYVKNFNTIECISFLLIFVSSLLLVRFTLTI